MTTSFSMQAAEVMVSIWRLSLCGDESLHDRDGNLDRALEASCQLWPHNLSNQLTFGATAVGQRCAELPTMLHYLQEIGWVVAGGPDFVTVRLDMAHGAAEGILREAGFTHISAQVCGRRWHRSLSDDGAISYASV